MAFRFRVRNSYAKRDDPRGNSMQEYRVRRQEKLDNQLKMHEESSLFADLVILIDGRVEPSAMYLRHIIGVHGGRVLFQPNTTVTHVVAQNLSDKSLMEYSTGHRALPIVSPTWILDSIKAGFLQNHIPYTLPQVASLRGIDPSLLQKTDKQNNVGLEPSLGRGLTGLCVPRQQITETTVGSLPDTSAKDAPLASYITRWVEPQFGESFEESGGPNVVKHIFSNLGGLVTGASSYAGTSKLSEEAIQNIPSVLLPLSRTYPLSLIQELQRDDEVYMTGHNVHLINAYVRELQRCHINLQSPLRAFKKRQCYQPKTSNNTGIEPNSVASVNAVFNTVSEYHQQSRLHHLATWKIEATDFLLENNPCGPPPNGSRVHQFLARIREQMMLAVQYANDSSLGCTVDALVRKIELNRFSFLHIDIDNFFVAGTLLSLPPERQIDTLSRPIFICSNSNIDSRAGSAVISSCNYIARKAGVRNGMWISEARKLCPNATILPYAFETYKHLSRKFYDTIRKYSNAIAVVSCDECFMDVSGQIALVENRNDLTLDMVKEVYSATSLSAEKKQSAECSKVPFFLHQALLNIVDIITQEAYHFAEVIKSDVRTTCSLNVSIGIGSSPFNCRLATKIAKPNGVWLLTRRSTYAYLTDKDVEILPGVSDRLSSAIFASFKVRTCGALRIIPAIDFCKLLGNNRGMHVRHMIDGFVANPYNDFHPIRIQSSNTVKMSGTDNGYKIFEPTEHPSEQVVIQKSLSVSVNYNVRTKISYANSNTHIQIRKLLNQPERGIIELRLLSTEVYKLLYDIIIDIISRMRSRNIGFSSTSNICLKVHIRAPGEPFNPPKIGGMGRCVCSTRIVAVPSFSIPDICLSVFQLLDDTLAALVIASNDTAGLDAIQHVVEDIRGMELSISNVVLGCTLQGVIWIFARVLAGILLENTRLTGHLSLPKTDDDGVLSLFNVYLTSLAPVCVSSSGSPITDHHEEPSLRCGATSAKCRAMRQTRHMPHILVSKTNLLCLLPLDGVRVYKSASVSSSYAPVRTAHYCKVLEMLLRQSKPVGKAIASFTLQLCHDGDLEGGIFLARRFGTDELTRQLLHLRFGVHLPVHIQ